MSLIDEALKRAELEAARRDGLRGWIAAIIVSLGLAVAVAVWLIGRPAPIQSTVPAAPVQGPTSRVQGSSGTRFETVEVAPPPVGLPSSVPAAREKNAEVVKPGTESKRPTPPFDTARARIAPPREPGQTGAAKDGKPAGTLVDGRTYAGEITLPDGPKIQLEGIVFSEVNPVALINGKVLPPGGVVEEFTIVSIKPDRVELNGRGATIVLTLK